MTSSQHYALLPSINGGSNPLFLNESAEKKKEDPRSELIDLYQTYADMYPNPRLIEEIRMRDTLQQASSAAKTANNSGKKISAKRPGFFARLFGKNNGEDETVAEPHEVLSGDALIYTDVDNELDDGSLCGTMQSIDSSCIPIEVYSLARFHLASTRTRREQPNALSECTSTPASSTTLVVVGLGEIAEFSTSNEPRISKTSDREMLLAYAKATDEYQLHYVRATSLAPNCIAVSWGFMDGIVVVYRRIAFDDLDYGWTVVWMLGPSDQVLEHMSTRDFYHDEKDHPVSPLLRVSECIPLKVETGEPYEPIVLTLALARLGGYIELIPVARSIWNGPVLNRDNHKAPGPPSRRRKELGQHYSTGRPIESPPNTLALTTAHCHIDIISLQALRTSVTADSHWDNNAFPNSPPSEYILCASGMNQEGYETISFWATSTIFSEAPDPNGGVAVQLHSTLIEVISADTGADVTAFATPGILKRWRMPRTVALSLEQSLYTGEHREAEDTKMRVSTISTTAPLVTLQFFQNTDYFGRPFLALLDWNGGVTVLECSVLERLAAQSVSQEEYDQHQNADDQEPFPLVACLATRGQFVDLFKDEAAISSGQNDYAQIRNLIWMNPTATPEAGLSFPPLVFILDQHQRVAVVTFAETISVSSFLFPGMGGTTLKSCKNGVFHFVSRRRGKRGPCFNHFTMQQLEPVKIVESFAMDNKNEEAILAASKLSDHHQAMLSKTIENCHLQVWRRKPGLMNFKALQSASSIAQEGLHLCLSDDMDGDLTMYSLRTICQFAISSGEGSRPAQGETARIMAFLVRLGTYELLCRLFAKFPSITHFRKTFQHIPILQLGKELAQRAEIDGLSIVVFRHKLEIGESILDILQQIPLSIDPVSFMHLLPETGEATDRFLNPTDVSAGAFVHWSSMPQFLFDRNGTKLVLDAIDEKNVLLYRNFNLQSQREFIGSTSVASWFLERAKMSEIFVGNSRFVESLCELGLRCAGIPIGTEPISSLTPTGHLYQSWMNASSLQLLLMDSDSLAVCDTSAFTIGINHLQSMDLMRLTNMVLHASSETEQPVAKYSQFLLPLLSNVASPENQRENPNVRSSLALHCIGLVSQSCKSYVSGQSVEQWAEGLLKSLSISGMIATASRTSIPKVKRVIRERSDLIHLFLAVLGEVAGALEQVNAPHRIVRSILRSIWVIYEMMPADLSKGDIKETEEGIVLEHEMKLAFQALVGMDIIAEWPGCNPFAFHSKLCRFRNLPRLEWPTAGINTILEVFHSFQRQLQEGIHAEACLHLLQDLLSDVVLLNRTCFDGAISIPALLADQLVPLLLRNHSFPILAAFISVRKDLVDRDLIKIVVLEFFEELVFSLDGGHSSDVFASIVKCEEIVGPVFREIRPSIISVRQCVEASLFLNTVIYDGNSNVEAISPATVRRTLPLDIVGRVLNEVPESLTFGCSQWSDLEYARDANALIRQNLEPKSTDTNVVPRAKELPILPAGAIFQLATILGLEDEVGATVVKCCVIHRARNEGIQGAAAAICRSFVQDVDNAAFGTGPIAFAKIGAIASVVEDESYSDNATKVELCHAALNIFKGTVDRVDSRGFLAISNASSRLDAVNSCFDPLQQNVLLSRSFARLHHFVAYEYKADMRQLFSDLQSQVSKGTIHVAIMAALGRFMLYWCISDSMNFKPRIDQILRIQGRKTLVLGCSLILHIPSKSTSIGCVHELQKLIANQAEGMLKEKLFGRHNEIAMPDALIVKRLTERGYSVNAASRAACITENQSYNEALSWAVAHMFDKNFNLPTLILRPQRCELIDEGAVQNLRQTLNATNQILKHQERMASFLGCLLNKSETSCGDSAIGTPRRKGSERSHEDSSLPFPSSLGFRQTRPNNDFQKGFATAEIIEGSRPKAVLKAPGTMRSLGRSVPGAEGVGADDRQRLIEEGRQLWKEVSRTRSVFNTPSAPMLKGKR
eukprot:scaffold22581_cov123-Cylindrotheca_fusiformis.AAC.18